MDGACNTRERNLQIKLFYENLKKNNDLEDLNTDGKTLLKYILKKLNGNVWTGLNWPMMVTSGVFL
jgi:hypothetical protein